MPKLLQIDSCRGILSTGRISEGIAQAAMRQGWDCYIAHGSRYVGETCQKSYQIGSKATEYLHFIKSFLFDSHGLGSVFATKQLVNWIKDLRPDVIQLHCVHGYYLNYDILFKYLNTTNIPIVWTFHDCWAITGHCASFDTINCNRWKSVCYDCPLFWKYPKALLSRASKNFQIKKEVFSHTRNLHIVSVSRWMDSIVKDSFFREVPHSIITNGVDLQAFAPQDEERKREDGIVILGVSSNWNDGKGLRDFFLLRERLSPIQYKIILVGLSNKQIQQLPPNILGLPLTNSSSALAIQYASADVFINPTYADSSSMVNIEALACGTPVITYKTGGALEIVDENTGVVVDKGDIDGIIAAVHTIENSSDGKFSKMACRRRTEAFFNKKSQALKYITLYDKLRDRLQ